eukprot:jgi/Ulvmu1/5802/UM025_0057.1
MLANIASNSVLPHHRRQAVAVVRPGRHLHGSGLGSSTEDVDAFQASLDSHGVQVEHVNDSQLSSTGQASFTGASRGSSINIQVIAVAQAPTHVRQDILKHCRVCHPHVLAPRTVLNDGRFISIVTDEPNGGGLYPMVRRGGDGGLAAPGARFMTQQLAVTADYLHGQGLFLHQLSPSALMVKWGDRSLPVVMVRTYQLPGDAIFAAGKATLHTAAQDVRRMARARAATRRSPLSHASAAPDATASTQLDNAYKVACDVWAIAVSFYFQLFGAFPFIRDQLSGWAACPAAQWDSDTHVSFMKRDGSVVDERIVTWLKDVFACGRLSEREFAERLGSMRSALLEQAWFVEDLPEGAAAMKKQYTAMTQSRSGSKHMRAIAAVLELPHASDAATPDADGAADAAAGAAASDASATPDSGAAAVAPAAAAAAAAAVAAGQSDGSDSDAAAACDTGALASADAAAATAAEAGAAGAGVRPSTVVAPVCSHAGGQVARAAGASEEADAAPREAGPSTSEATQSSICMQETQTSMAPVDAAAAPVAAQSEGLSDADSMTASPECSQAEGCADGEGNIPGTYCNQGSEGGTQTAARMASGTRQESAWGQWWETGVRSALSQLPVHCVPGVLPNAMAG